MTANQGFSLLELTIVCGLVAILLSLAVPSYSGYVLRAQRVAAIEQMYATAACQERIYADEYFYDKRRCLMNTESENYQFKYELTEPARSKSFVLIAQPLNGQAHDKCGWLSLSETGMKIIGGPKELQRKCWQGR